MTEKTKTPKNILLIEINDSFENLLILVSDCIFENLITNNTNDVIMIIVINPSKYSPLSGSFANEWTLSIIPERTIKAPNKLNEKTIFY